MTVPIWPIAVGVAMVSVVLAPPVVSREVTVVYCWGTCTSTVPIWLIALGLASVAVERTELFAGASVEMVVN
jgi:hypothetical protein